MDRNNQENICPSEKKQIKIEDERLIEFSNTIYDEITQKHKPNDKKLRYLLSKCCLISQNTIVRFEEHFKNDVIKELEGHFDDYKKLETYKTLSRTLDNEISETFRDLKQMEFNIGEANFVDHFKNLSDNINSTKQFIEDSRIKINKIYKRIENLTRD